MALTLMELVTKLTLDATQYDSGLDSAKEKASTFLTSVEGLWTNAKNIGNKVSNFAQSLTNFFQPILDTTAEVESEGRQMVAVFGDFAPEMGKAFKLLESNTGVLASRFMTVGTRAFLQFTSAGMDTNEALHHTYKLMQHAADGAAMYDVSLEDAADRMLKFVRGTTVGGEAIGLFTSIADRNARAAEMFSSKWLNLTEKERELLMLGTIDDLYEQSKVIGMAAAETHTWETATGNLTDAWKQATAVFGKPFLVALIPSIERLTDWLTKNPDKIAAIAEGLGTAVGSIVDGFVSFADLIASGALTVGDGVANLFGFDGGILTVGAALNSGSEEELQKALDAMQLQIRPEVVVGRITSGMLGLTPWKAAEELGDYGIDLKGKNGPLFLTEGGSFVLPGEYATGLDYVPYDDFPALLHTGEKVLTAREAEEMREGTSGIDYQRLADVLADAVASSVSAAMANVNIQMDGNAVGRIVAPAVSTVLAREVNRRRYI